jgi:hypothetical protein
MNLTIHTLIIIIIVIIGTIYLLDYVKECKEHYTTSTSDNNYTSTSYVADMKQLASAYLSVSKDPDVNGDSMLLCPNNKYMRGISIYKENNKIRTRLLCTGIKYDDNTVETDTTTNTTESTCNANNRQTETYNETINVPTTCYRRKVTWNRVHVGYKPNGWRIVKVYANIPSYGMAPYDCVKKQTNQNTRTWKDSDILKLNNIKNVSCSNNQIMKGIKIESCDNNKQMKFKASCQPAKQHFNNIYPYHTATPESTSLESQKYVLGTCNKVNSDGNINLTAICPDKRLSNMVHGITGDIDIQSCKTNDNKDGLQVKMECRYLSQ